MAVKLNLSWEEEEEEKKRRQQMESALTGKQTQPSTGTPEKPKPQSTAQTLDTTRVQKPLYKYTFTDAETPVFLNEGVRYYQLMGQDVPQIDNWSTANDVSRAGLRYKQLMGLDTDAAEQQLRQRQAAEQQSWRQQYGGGGRAGQGAWKPAFGYSAETIQLEKDINDARQLRAAEQEQTKIRELASLDLEEARREKASLRRDAIRDAASFRTTEAKQKEAQAKALQADIDRATEIQYYTQGNDILARLLQTWGEDEFKRIMDTASSGGPAPIDYSDTVSDYSGYLTDEERQMEGMQGISLNQIAHQRAYEVSETAYIGTRDAVGLKLKELGIDNWDAEKIIDYYKRLQDEEGVAKNAVKMQEIAGKNAGTAALFSVLSTFTNVFAGMGAADALVQKLTHPDRPVSYDGLAMAGSLYTEAVRGQVSSDIRQSVKGKTGSDFLAGAGSFLYQNATSQLDSSVNAALNAGGLGNFGLGLLGSSAAASTMREAHERGLSDDQVLTMGIISGVTEYLTEKIGMDTFMETLLGKGRGRSFLSNLLINAGAEGSEETISGLVGFLSDLVIAGDQSQLMQDAKEIGMGRALAKQAGEIGLETLGGVLSGGAAGSFGHAVGHISDAHVGSNYATAQWASQQAGKQYAFSELTDATAQRAVDTAATRDKGSMAKAVNMVLQSEEAQQALGLDFADGTTVTDKRTAIKQAITERADAKTAAAAGEAAQALSQLQEQFKDAEELSDEQRRQYTEAVKTLQEAVEHLDPETRKRGKAVARVSARFQRMAAAEQKAGEKATTEMVKQAARAMTFSENATVQDAAVKVASGEKKAVSSAVSAVLKDAEAQQVLGLDFKEGMSNTDKRTAISAALAQLVENTQMQAVDEVARQTEGAEAQAETPSESAAVSAEEELGEVDERYLAEEAPTYEVVEAAVLEENPNATQEEIQAAYDADMAEYMARSSRQNADSRQGQQIWVANKNGKGGRTMTYAQFEQAAQSQAAKNGQQFARSVIQAAWDQAVVDTKAKVEEHEAKRKADLEDTAKRANETSVFKNMGYSVRVSYDDEEFKSENVRVNAFVNPGTKEIVFNGNVMESGGALLWYLGHEVTHKAAEVDRRLVDNIIKVFTELNKEGKLTGQLARMVSNMDARIKQTQRLYQAHENERAKRENREAKTISEDAAKEEVAADLMRYAFQQTKLYQDIVGKDVGLAVKMRQAVSKMLKAMTGDGRKNSAVQKRLQEIADQLDKALDAAAKANTRISDPGKAGDVELGVKQPGALQFSIAPYWERNYKSAFTGGFARSLAQDNGEYVFLSGREVLAQMLERNGVSFDIIDNVLAYMDKAAYFMRDAGVTYRNIGLDDVNNAKIEVRTDEDGKPLSIVLSAMVKNGEYPVNFDLTQICKRREAMSKYMDKLLQDHPFNTFSLDQESLMRMQKILSEEGYDTACLGCFVEAKRFYMEEFVTKFVDKWNAAVHAINPDAEYFGFSDADTKVTPKEIAAADAAMEAWKRANTETADRKREETGKKNAQASNEERVGNLVNSDPVFQKLLRPEDLLTTHGLRKFTTLSDALPGLLAGSYGSGAPKLAQGFIPYNNEIAYLPDKVGSKNLNNYLQGIAGLRSQSFSDFKIENVFDYLQMLADLTARGLPAHMYTKELACARILGMSGVKVNMSVMFTVEGEAYWGDKETAKKYAGLRRNANGNLVYSFADQAAHDARLAETGEEIFVQSIDVAGAMALQTDPAYGKYVGIIGVGYSDEHIRMMLRDPNFRYVIPYHRSGLPVQISDMANLYLADDYTGTQNTLRFTVQETVEGKKRDVDLRRLGVHFDTAEEFLRWVEDNGYELKTNKAVNGHGEFDLYGDLAKTRDPKQTAKNYQQWCWDQGYLPLFYQFMDEENYYKLLYDFSVTDENGNCAPQENVRLWDENGKIVGMPKNAFAKNGLVDQEMAAQNERNAALYSPENVERVEQRLYDTTRYDRQFSIESPGAAEKYSWESLSQKAPIKIVSAPVVEIPTTKRGKIDYAKFAPVGKTGAATLSNEHGKTQSYVHIPDIGENVLINRHGVNHGIQGRITNSSTMSTAEVTAALPDILRNSIAVNELTSREGRPEDGLYSYILFGYARRTDGQEYLVRSTVNHRGSNQSVVDSVEVYNVLKGIKAKKVEAHHQGSYTEETSAAIDPLMDTSTMSVADLLEIVKNNHPELLSDSLREHFGVETPKAEGLRFSISPEQDAEYLALTKNPEANAARLQEMVDEAARASGYDSPVLYHGTTAFGFTVFGDPKKVGFFFTDRLETASTYSGRESVNQISKKVRRDKAGNRRGNYSVYIKAKNLLTVDCKFRNWDDIAIPGNEIDRADGRFYGLEVTNDTRYGWSDYTTTDNIVAFAKEKGYDGVVFENLRDNSNQNPRYRSVVEGGKGEKLGVSTVYAVFDSEQIKSADPVTYDDKGNVIPLSERFNMEKEDIRYSISPEQDTEVLTPQASEMRINAASEEISSLSDRLEWMDTSDPEYKTINNRIAKLEHERDKLIAEEQKHVKRVSLQEVLDDLDDYRLMDLRVIANQLTQYAWDEVEELSPNELKAGIREIISNMELSPLQMQDRRSGVDVRTPRTPDQQQLNTEIEASEVSDASSVENARQYSLEEQDSATLDFLNRQLEAGEYVTTYKSMRLDDGELHSPMAAMINGRFENEYKLGTWYRATEHPELIKLNKQGNPEFKLDKGRDANGKKLGDVPARYNPYEHSSNFVINDQFTTAYKRPNLVVVEMRIPKSELTSGYRAQYAKDPVGWTGWKSGPVGTALAKIGKNRDVLLSRWAMPVRILPNEEVAQKYKELLDGTGIEVPDNVVTPGLLTELKKVGVPIKQSGLVESTEDQTQFSISPEQADYDPNDDPVMQAFFDAYEEAQGEGQTEKDYPTLEQRLRAAERAQKKAEKALESEQAKRSLAEGRAQTISKEANLAWTIYTKKRLREQRRMYQDKLNQARRDKLQAVEAAVRETRELERARADVRVDREREMADRRVKEARETWQEQARKRLGIQKNAYEKKLTKAKDRAAHLRENLRLQSNAGKAALRNKTLNDKKRAENEEETSQAPIDTIRKMPDKQAALKRLSDAAHGLRTKGRKAYAQFVSKAAPLERFSGRQKSVVKADILATIYGGTDSTVENIFKEGLVNRSGDRIGDSFADVFLCTKNDKGKVIDENKQALLQDYMLHRHNIARMGIEAKAKANVEAFEEAHPELRDMSPRDFGLLLSLSDKEAEKAGKAEAKKLAKQYQSLISARLNDKNKAIFADEAGQAVTAETSREVVEKYERENPWLKEKADAIYRWWDLYMRTWVVGDLMSEEQYNYWKNLYPDYVPTYRVGKPGLGAGFGRNTIAPAKVDKRATGSFKEVVNIEDSFANLIQRHVNESRKNELLKNITDTAMVDNDGLFGDFAYFAWDEYAEQNDIPIDAISDLGVNLEEREKLGLEQVGKDYRITAMYNGVPASTYVSKEMYDSLSYVFGLVHDRLDTVARIGGMLTRPMKTAITGINPVFMLRNVMRDIPTAIINSQATSFFGVDYMYWWFRAWGNIALPVLHGAGSKQWQNYVALGGTNSMYYNQEGGFAKNFNMKPGAKGLLQRGWNNVKTTAGWMNETIEQVTRFAEYLATVKKYGDTYENRLRGIKNAAEVTVDFSRHGEYGQAINNWIPYWNPAVQGIDKMVRSVVQTQDGRSHFAQAARTLTRAALTTTLLEAVLHALLKSLGRDKDWEELDDRTKDTYYCIPLPEEHRFLKIPKNREWGAILGTPLMRILEGIDGREDPFKNYVETSLLPNFLPGMPLYLDENGKPKSDIIGFSQALDVAAGRDFANRRIVPYAYESGSKAGQYDGDTSVFSKWLSDAIGNKVGPMEVDFLLKDYFGDFGKLFVRGTSQARVSGETEESVGDVLTDLTWYTPWNVDSRASNHYTTEYYDLMTRLEQETKDMENHAVDDSYKQDPKYQAYSAMKKLYGKEISALNKQAAETLDREEKGRLKGEAVVLARAAMEFYEDCMNGSIPNPTAFATYADRPEELRDELVRLDGLAKDYAFEPSKSTGNTLVDTNSLKIGNSYTREYKLDDEAKTKRDELRDQAYNEQLSKVISSSAYRSASDTEKAEMLEAARQDAYDDAAEDFMKWLQKNRNSTEKGDLPEAFTSLPKSTQKELSRLSGVSGTEKYNYTPSTSTTKSYGDPDSKVGNKMTREYILDDAAIAQHNKKRDELYADYVGRVINSSAYRSASDARKAEMLAEARKSAYEDAKEWFMAWLKKNRKSTPKD